MAVYKRDQNKVLFIPDSGTYSAGSASSGLWLGLVTNHSPTESENIIEIRYAGTANRNFGQLVNGPKDYEGTITYHPQSFQLVGYALGSMVDVSGTTSQHTVSELNGDGNWAYTSGTANLTNFPSFTVRDSKRGLADGQHLVRIFNGAVIDSFKLTAEQNNPVECEVTYKAQEYVLGSKTAQILSTSNEDTSRPYIWSDGIITFDGTVMNEANSFEWTVENNVENRHYVNGSKVAQAMVPTMRNHEISLSLDANSSWGKTLSDYHKNGSVFNLKLALTQSATENGTFSFSGCKVFELEMPSEVEGIDEFNVTIKPQAVSFAGSDAVAFYNPY